MSSADVLTIGKRTIWLALAGLVVAILTGSVMAAPRSPGAGAPPSLSNIQAAPLVSPSPSPTPACTPAWAIVPSVNVTNGNNNLIGIAAVSANDMWATGDYDDVGGPGGGTAWTLIHHWGGSQWSVVPSPNVITGTNDVNYLQRVAAVSASDVWAVGYIEGPDISPPDQALIEHWDGNQWQVVPNANISYNNMLHSVAAVAANDIWAVGYQDGPGAMDTLILHWNGIQWQAVPSPNPSTQTNELWGVATVSANDVWAIGYYYDQSLRYNQPLMLHWDGTQWSRVPAYGPTGTVLFDATAASTNDVWAVGYGSAGTLTMHWNGTQWSVVPSPNGGGYSTLYGVSAISTNDVWATGYGEIGTLTIHWNGTQWSIVPSPNPPGSYGNNLYDVSALLHDNVWAVGTYSNGQFGRDRTMIQRYTYQCLTPSPTATPTSIPTATPTSTATSMPTIPPSRTVTTTVTVTVTAATITSTPTPTSTPPPSTPTPTSCMLQFTDVPPDSPFYPFIRCLACGGIINGYSEGCESGNPCFRPGNSITRGQIAKIVSNAAGFNETESGLTFEDVQPGSTFYTYTERLTHRGVMSGYLCGNPEPCVPPTNRPYFRPYANATRGQIAKIVSNAALFADPPTGQIFEDVLPGSDFYTYTQRLASRMIMNGYPCGNPEPCIPPDNRPYFRPGNEATRGQTSKIVANTFFPGCNPPR